MQNLKTSTRIRSIILTLCIFFLFPSAVFSDGFRCAGGVVIDGDTKEEVLSKCGPPSSKRNVGNTKERNYLIRKAKMNSYTGVNFEQWVYNPGSGKFIRVITFSGKQVVSIDLGKKVE